MADDNWPALLGSAPTLKYDMPKWFQIAAQLRVGIQANGLLAHTPLPSVQDLARIYRVTRTTARKAYQSLEDGGYVIVEHGRPPYVAGEDKERKPLARPRPKAQDPLTGQEFAAMLEVFENIERHLHRIADALDPQREYER